MPRLGQLQRRKPNRNLSIHKRYVAGYSLSSNEQVYLRKLRKRIIEVSSTMRNGDHDAPTRRRLVVVYIVFTQMYNNVVRVRHPAGDQRLLSKSRGFDSFDESQVGYYYKHRKADLIREFNLLLDSY